MEIEPQSIVHQVIRLERKVTRMVMRTTVSLGSRSRGSRRKKSSHFEDPSKLGAVSLHAYSLRHASSLRASSRQLSAGTSSCCDESGVVSKYGSGDEESTFNGSRSPEESPVFDEKEIKELTVSVPEIHYGDCRTINQNEFFVECMINGEGASSVIHFFDKENALCREVDVLLEKMAKKFTTCKFLRIDSAWTHFISAKLGIEKFPTVLAIRDKVVLDRLSDFEEMDLFFSEEFLQEWLLRTIPLIK